MRATRIGPILAGLSIVALAVFAAPSGAQAGTSVPASAGTSVPASPPAVQQADGYFYVWNNASFRGTRCRWAGNAANWGRCRNRASSALNNGYLATYDDVNVYWGANYGGAWHCVVRGRRLHNMEYDRFNRGRGRPGFGQVMNDNASSHRWVRSC